jgi:sugar lactone lactonase YvrE
MQMSAQMCFFLSVLLFLPSGGIAQTITTVAGNEERGFAGDEGSAVSAQLDTPSRVGVDSAGNLYIADTNNNRIRKITPAGIIATIAGNGKFGFEGDGGVAISAALSSPEGGIVVDRLGNILFADSHAIRKISLDGTITAFAGISGSMGGFSGDGGPGTAAQMFSPHGLAVDSAGNLFVADSGNNRIRKITPDGLISTVAGNGNRGFGGDGGPATSAQLFFPFGIAVDAAGNLYIADSFNNRIRKVTPAGIISTIAGNGTTGSGGDGGPATSAQLNQPADVALDAAGNLYIADVGNMRVRKFAPSGTISTLAGTTQGFAGDGGPASAARLNNPSGIAVDSSGDVFIADSANHRIRKVTASVPAVSSIPYSIKDLGGVSVTSSGASNSIVVGYARIQPTAGSTAPSGLAIFGFRQNNVLVTEAGVPASPAIQSGRIYAEINATVNTGLAIANPNGQAANLTFFFTDAAGNSGNGSMTIPANGQTAAFLNQAPFNSRSPFLGSFTFNSSVPVSVIALRGLTNERSEFLITTLPVADLSAASSSNTILFPHFADGGGWTTQIVLTNPTDSSVNGTLQFLSKSGQPTTLTVNNQTASSFSYSIPARSSQKLTSSGSGSTILGGSVRVVPTGSGAAPSGVAIFSFRFGGITVAEAGVPASKAANTLRLYAALAGDFNRGAVGSVQTGLAIANPSASVALVTLTLTRLDGASTGVTTTIPVPPGGQFASFMNQLAGFSVLQPPFEGVLRISSTAPIAIVGLRGRYNERGDFLITTTAPIDETTATSSTPIYFPHIADGGGYTTQFILFSGQAGQSPSGTMQFSSQSGGNLSLGVR